MKDECDKKLKDLEQKLAVAATTAAATTAAAARKQSRATAKEDAANIKAMQKKVR